MLNPFAPTRLACMRNNLAAVYALMLASVREIEAYVSIAAARQGIADRVQ
jgi:hypothetical protein